MNARRLIGAVLAPHHAENSQLRPRRLAPAKQFFNPLVFISRQAVVTQNFGSDRRSRQGAHVGNLYFLIFPRKSKDLFTVKSAKKTLAFSSLEIHTFVPC